MGLPYYGQTHTAIQCMWRLATIGFLVNRYVLRKNPQILLDLTVVLAYAFSIIGRVRFL